MSEYPLVAPPTGPSVPSVIEGLSTVEVRWILPGQLDAAVAGWFGRFPAGLDSREDIYLIHPVLRGLSVKIRAGQLLEVKQYFGSPGILDAAGRARGRIESWRKWSFPFGQLGPERCPAAWLDGGAQETAGEPIPAGRRAARGRRRGAGHGAGMQGGTHRSPLGW